MNMIECYNILDNCEYVAYINVDSIVSLAIEQFPDCGERAHQVILSCNNGDVLVAHHGLLCYDDARNLVDKLRLFMMGDSGRCFQLSLVE